MVSAAVGKLKAFKRDGTYMYNTFTNHIIHGTTKLYSIIADLFNAMIIHGLTPKEMLGGTIIPIPKQKGKTKSENNRSVTLGTVLLKVFDIMLLMLCNEHLNTLVNFSLVLKGSHRLQPALLHCIVYCWMLPKRTIVWNFVNFSRNLEIIR